MNDWTHRRPAPTVAGDPRIAPPGCKHIAAGCCSANRDGSMTGPQFGKGTLRVTIDEAATLQGYPADFAFEGLRTKQFLQVGNAVPPPVARAVLEHLWKEAA